MARQSEHERMRILKDRIFPGFEVVELEDWVEITIVDPMMRRLADPESPCILGLFAHLDRDNHAQWYCHCDWKKDPTFLADLENI